MKIPGSKKTWIIIDLLLIAFIYFLAARSFGKSYTVNEYFGEDKDSLIVGIKAGNTITWADTMTSISRYDTTFALGGDTLWTFYYRYKSPGTDYWGSGFYDLALPYSSAQTTWLWAQPLYWDFETDSVHGYLYRNGSATPVPLIMTTARTDTSIYDTAISTGPGVDYRMEFLIYPAGGDSVKSYESRLYWDTTGAGVTDTIYAPEPSVVANVCNVYGYVKGADNQPLPYAKVTFTLPEKVNNSCDSSLMMKRTRSTRTGATGYFQIPLTYSSCLDNKKYNMTVHYSGLSDITRTITVPDDSLFQVYW